MRIEGIKIGQRIVLTKEAETGVLDYGDSNSNFKAGMSGEIIGIANTTSGRVLIEFEDYIDGHSGDSKGKRGHCWWFNKEDLIRIAKIRKRKNNY